MNTEYKETRQLALHLSGEYFIQSLSLLSLSSRPSIPPVFPLHALSGQCCTWFTLPTPHDSLIEITWVSWPDLAVTLIKQGDRLLAISSVYPAEQTPAEVESRKQSEDQCRIWSKAFYHAASISGVCHRVILHTCLIESQFNHLLKVITIPL